MRVIAGEFRSRRLKSPEGLATRPTPDRLRESLFNVLAPMIEDTVFVDAYAGSGAVGIEALSRGARRAIFIERSRSAVQVLRDNLHSLGLDARAQVIHGSVGTYLKAQPGDIVFLDPPYELEKEYETCLAALGEDPQGIVIAQHARRMALDELYGNLIRYRVLNQGDNSLSFYRRLEEAAEEEERLA
ncbi:MAG: 16S rRNA (guanine(966)-N(2))-methyltransferase RsmD [Bryobacterales bacterium]|nr:16S rRNA (guanine(966)-N(2))-methyltransferase RsmD [Bryobacterales bacterium]